MVRLIQVTDGDFAWLAGEGAGRRGLRLPPGGVDTEESLEVIRDIHAALVWAGARGTWMMVAGGEVVGLCGYRGPPADGEVEIGYGVAPERRCLGHATAAVAAMLALAAQDPALAVMRAVTAVDNAPSRRVLERNGFSRVGEDLDPHDGPVVRWRRSLR
jgi:RimJ/RimL family protein N-acetyltransferase